MQFFLRHMFTDGKGWCSENDTCHQEQQDHEKYNYGIIHIVT